MSTWGPTPGMFLDAAHNMALDEALDEALAYAGDEPPRWVFLRTLLERHNLEVALLAPGDEAVRPD